MIKNNTTKPDENMPGWPINGVPVKRQVGMIYWYSWGNQEFDIRVMRSVLGLPEENANDTYFINAKPDKCGSFQSIMIELESAIGNRRFSDAMIEHDRIIDQKSKTLWEKLEDSRKIVLDDMPF
jgi:hypothetical protein